MKILKMFLKIEFWAFLISAVAFGFSLYTFFEQRKLNHLHITPTLSCKFEYPIKIINGKLIIDKSFPEIIITNTSPISISSFSVDIKYYIYDKAKSKIIIYGESGYNSHEHFIFKKTFDPGDHINKRDMAIEAQDGITIHEFNLTYYRPNDMKKFIQKELFFIEKGNIFSHKGFLNNSSYADIIQKKELLVNNKSISLFSFKNIDKGIFLIEPGEEFEAQKKGENHFYFKKK